MKRLKRLWQFHKIETAETICNIILNPTSALSRPTDGTCTRALPRPFLGFPCAGAQNTSLETYSTP